MCYIIAIFYFIITQWSLKVDHIIQYYISNIFSSTWFFCKLDLCKFTCNHTCDWCKCLPAEWPPWDRWRKANVRPTLYIPVTEEKVKFPELYNKACTMEIRLCLDNIALREKPASQIWKKHYQVVYQVIYLSIYIYKYIYYMAVDDNAYYPTAIKIFYIRIHVITLSAMW